MTDPNTVAPDAATLIPASESAETALDFAKPAEPEAKEPSETPEPSEPVAAEDASDKARKAMQRRIDRLTAEKYQERARAELWERQFRETREQPAQQQTPKTAEEIRRDVKAELARESAAKEFADKCNAIGDKWKAASPSFQADFDSLVSMAGPLVEDDGSPSSLLKAAMTADAPSKVLAHLAANPEVLAGLVDLDTPQQARKIALIEQSMSTPTRQPASTPKPLEPVRTTTAPSEPDPEKNPGAWIAYRNKQEAAKRQR